MGAICMVPIPKDDVLMEDFSYIQELIENIASDREQLLEARNSWEVFFMGYDDDPREISDIPEVKNWIMQSLEAGIPWFYFMRSPEESYCLLTFMSCYGSRDPEYPERISFDRKVLPFIKKNLENLEVFIKKYDILEDVGCEVTAVMMNYISEIIDGTKNDEKTAEDTMRDKQTKEALERLVTLEKLFGLNPKVRQYFAEEKLYYSYVTGNGYIGSIDTINYDERYAAIVKSFEEQTSYLVYHVIERKDTISLLFVSDDYNKWLDERPTSSGIMAEVVNVDSYEDEIGYIKLDCIQGALFRSNANVYSSMPGRSGGNLYLSAEDSEIIERLEILKNSGIITDLDIAKVYEQEDEICCSLHKVIMGMPLGLINRISAQPSCQQLLEMLSGQISKKFYFLMGSKGHELAFLYLSDDSDDWEIEKLMLEQNKAVAVVVNLEDMTARMKQIKYQMVNGGPLMVEE